MSKLTLTMRLRACAVASTLAMLPLCAGAAGLGKLTVLSVLGEPFKGELAISASREELSSLTARVAPQEAFKQAGIAYIPAFSGMRFAIEKRANGQPYLAIYSDRPLNEPFLDMLVQIDWASGRLVREYTVLLDPPRALQTPVAAAPPVVPPIAAATAGSARLNAVESRPSTPAAEAREKAAAASVSAGPVKPVAKEPDAPKKPTNGAGQVEKTTRLVKHGDTLAKIAREAAPSDVSLEQMLVALYRANQDAFDGHNMNRLRAGKILDIPAPEVVASVGVSDAAKTVVAQAADFNAYRRKLAAAAAATAPIEQSPGQAASGKIVPKIEEKMPPVAPGKDKLEVSKSVSAAGNSVAAGAAGRVLEEDLVSRDRALNEANSRIAELEKTVNDLKRLVELKSQSMAELEKQAQAPKPASPEGNEARPTVTPSPSPAPTVETPKLAEQSPQAAPESTVVASAPPPPPAPNPEQQPPVVKPPVAKPIVAQPRPERGFIAENPEIIYGGGAIVILLLGYVAYAAWRRKQTAATGGSGRVSQDDLATNSVFGTTGGQSVDTNSSLQTDFSQSGMGTIDTDEGVDPVAEADVYMAYGRDVQAEEILLDALKTDPTRAAIHLKLMEIYAARKSLKQFETVASEFYAQTGGTGPDWEKALPLIERVDPENPLYGRMTSSAKPDVADGPIAPDSERDAMIALPEEFGKIPDGIDVQSTQPLPAPGVTAPMPEEPPPSLDFNLDLDLPETAPQAAASDSKHAAAVVTSDDDAQEAYDSMKTLAVSRHEFSEEATADEVNGELDATDVGVKAPDVAAERMPMAEGGGEHLDLDLSVPSDQAAVPAEDVVTMELEQTDVKGGKPLDFDFEFGSETLPGVPPVATPARPAPTPVDLSMIDLDLGETPEIPSDTAETSSAQADVTVAPAFEEVATKLELAHAYEEMGDKEGARELLQEVINEGDATQQASARARLAQLA